MTPGISANEAAGGSIFRKTFPFPCLSGNALKVIALITMTIDHTGWILVRTQPLWYILRIIGRFAFPIYVFLLVQGDRYTHSRRSYVLRLGLFALISEIPFNLAEEDSLRCPEHQNVFFTLLIGELVLCLLAQIRERNGVTEELPRIAVFRQILPALESLTVVTGGMILAQVLSTDYGAGGVLLIALVSFGADWDLTAAFGVTAAAAVLWSSYWLQTIGCLSFLFPVTLYNGTRGRKNRLLQYGFYIYYPVHLLILAMIRQYCL